MNMFLKIAWVVVWRINYKREEWKQRTSEFNTPDTGDEKWPYFQT